MIKSYIENHLSEVLSLGKLSSALNMSQASLMRTLRNCADMTFVEYVTRERIERAKALIESQPHCRLKEIAAQVGFSDALYFSRVFRQYTGYPPSEYVKIIYTGK